MGYTYDHAKRWARAKIGSTVQVAYTGTSARSSQLSYGFYRLSATTDCYVAQGDVAINATSSGYPLYIGQEAWAQVDTDGSALTPPDDESPVASDKDTDDYIAAIRQSANGTLSISRVDSIK